MIGQRRESKLNEDVRERIRALEKWVWGAGAVLTAFIVIGGVVGDLDLIPDNEPKLVPVSNVTS